MRVLNNILIILVLCVATLAQATTRSVNLSWAAPVGGGVTNYTIYSCTVPIGGTSCTPNVNGTPLGTVTTTSFSTTEPVGFGYGFTVVANYPVCSNTSSFTTPCGGGGSVTVSFVPVPPQGTSATNVVIVVP